jgi:A/G-specific adenine glycosylase
MPSKPGPADPRPLRRPLLDWYRKNRRDLPWRRTRDPYAIWVSEVMLQQTRVAAALSYYERFLARFPDVRSLAGASEEEVLAAWSGLGYYRRALGLHRGARAVVAEHGGRLPGNAEGLRSLPGVGSYTAGAIASIAWGEAVPAVDGNVRRVLSRAFALADTGAAGERRIEAIAGELVAAGDAAVLNQAVMELGALVCTPASPRCRDCPIAARCRAFAMDRVRDFPPRRARPAPVDVQVVALWIAHEGAFVVERFPAGGPLRGTWNVPAIEVTAHGDGSGRRCPERTPAATLPPRFEDGASTPGASAASASGAHRPGVGPGIESSISTGVETAIASAFEMRHRVRIDVGRSLAALTHAIMDRRLRIDVRACRIVRGRIGADADLRWQPLDGLDALATSGATKKIVRALTRDAARAAPPTVSTPRPRARRPRPPAAPRAR